MSPSEWARIRDGQTFQALVGDLLKHRDPTIRVFNRPGRDLAIDMLSADGTTVYQAKFVGDRKFHKLKPKLLKELNRIGELRGQDRWKPVKHWVVVSNVLMNENDENGWQQVAARARELDLNSKLVWSDSLDKWLSDYPAVRQVFFDDVNRCFTTPEEIEAKLSKREGQGLGWRVDFVGRKQELADARGFLEAEDTLVLTITGAPGSGRTRLLREIGRLQELAHPRDVLWGLSKTLATSDQWTKALVKARPTLVLLDDPSPELVQRFFEQVENHLESWRLVVTQLAGAPPALDLQVRRSGLVHEIDPITPLTEEEATALARSLLPKAERVLDEPNLAKLVRLSGRLPYWIVEIVTALDPNNPRLLESLEQVASAAFDKMLRSVLAEETDRIKARRLLQWCSLYDRLAPDEREIVDFIATKAAIPPAEARWMLEQLLEIGGGSFGRRRVRLRPLPLRAALMTSLLASPETRRELALDLLASAPGASTSRVPQPERLAASLALAEPSKVRPLVGQVFDQLANLAKHEVRPSVKLRLLERGRAFAGASPERFVDLVSMLRRTPTDSETEEIPYVGTRTRTHADVIKSLPWPLFEVAGTLSTKDGQRRLLNELLAIADAELSLKLGVDRAGKSVSSVLPRVLRGEASFSRDYISIGEELATAAVASLVELGALDQLHASRLHLLVSPQLAVQERYSWSTPLTYSYSIGAFHPQSEEARVRRGLMDKMWALLESPLDSTKREFILSLLADGIRSAGTAHGLPGGSLWSVDFLADLRRTRDYFNHEPRQLLEFSAMREVWSRCLLIENAEDERRTIADTLEGLFQDATGLKWLLSPPSLRILESGKLLEEEASRRLRTPGELRKFIRRIRNLPKHEEWRGRPAAFAVGRLIADGADLTEVLRAAFQSQERTDRDFAGEVFVMWVEHVRRDRPATLRSVLDGQVRDMDKDTQLRLVKRLYALNFGPRAVNADAEFLLSRLDLLVGLGPWERFSILGKIVLLHWEQVTKIVEKMSATLATEESAHAWTGLIDGVWVAKFSVSPEHPLMEGQWEWLIQQCKWVANLDALGDMALYHARELKPKGHAGMALDWVASLLEYRSERFGPGPGVRDLPIQDEIWTLVARPTVGSRKSDQASLARLLTIYLQDQGADWSIRRLISRLDPSGIVAPDLIAERLRQLPDVSPELKAVLNWSSFASHYVEGSEAWEKIAVPACKIARQLSGDDQNSVLWSLRWSEPVVEIGRPGRPSRRWDSERQTAERNLQRLEPSDPVRSFWEWKTKYCQAWGDHEAKRIEEGEE